jgi:hypothetical protein
MISALCALCATDRALPSAFLHTYTEGDLPFEYGGSSNEPGATENRTPSSLSICLRRGDAEASSNFFMAKNLLKL